LGVIGLVGKTGLEGVTGAKGLKGLWANGVVLTGFSLGGNCLGDTGVDLILLSGGKSIGGPGGLILLSGGKSIGGPGGGILLLSGCAGM
tara:strand:+ start:19 stop:285 length:267 start_codon:yes stop_codon:yes gene_type:complete